MRTKQYMTPLCEVMEVRYDLMKMTGEASLPGQMGGAPERKPGHGHSEAPVF